MGTESGLDILVKDKFSSLRHKRVAILANQASVNREIKHLVSLAVFYGVKVVKLFAPEHGFTGMLQDMEQVSETRHHKLNIPVISLYGDHKASLKLNAKHLDDVDVLLCDLQDIGSRYYTFHCTIAWAMAACSLTKTKLVIIDRPNPISANIYEGNLVKAPHFSFVGAYPLLNRHGFTMGELVRYVRDVLKVDFDLEVLWMNNYSRHAYFEETGLPFVPPSPNMPSVKTAVVYPGMCLIEGTNLSEGRGTCTPFELVGAPFIRDEDEFKAKIDDFGFPGVTLRACRFVPKFQKHANVDCGGVFIHVIDREKFQPLRFALSLIAVAQSYHGFDWRREPYEYETERLAIDLLLGDQNLRMMLENKAFMSEIFDMIADEEAQFAKIREDYLYYSGD